MSPLTHVRPVYPPAGGTPRAGPRPRQQHPVPPHLAVSALRPPSTAEAAAVADAGGP